MYCVKCGVHLADTEKRCPLCNTVVYHPELPQAEAEPLYPAGKMPKYGAGRPFLCGALLILFMIPLVLTFLSDIQSDGKLDWFGYVLGGLALIYLIIALPLWFRHPNAVIFVPCDFLGCAIYLFFINLATGGNWFFPFALPIVSGVAVIICTLVTLFRYLRKGKLYAIGGSIMGFGALIFMIEYLMHITFGTIFLGWSYYPLITLFIVGGLLIYLAINSVAREKIERKLFF